MPITFLATTVNVYGVPFTSPARRSANPGGRSPGGGGGIGRDGVVELISATAVDEVGTPKLTVAVALPRYATPITGALGTAPGVAVAGADGRLVPMPLVAVIENV